MNRGDQEPLQTLSRIDRWKHKAVAYEPVTGGITNTNWKVVVEGKAYFVKIPGTGAGSHIDRNNAHIANMIAAEEGIGPAVYSYFEDTGVEVFEWLEDYRVLNFGDVFNREIFYKIADTIRRFHHHKKKRMPLLQTPFEQTSTFMSLAQELNTYVPPEIDRMEWLAQKIEESIMATGIRYVPCHNDFWTANCLYNAKTGDLKLIDFEYAAMSDECWDFADMSTANYFTEGMDREWIRYYYGQYDELKFARMKLYKLLKDIAWAMWSLVQAKQSSVPDFDYYEWFGTKMARLRQMWSDPRIDYWLALVKGKPTF